MKEFLDKITNSIALGTIEPKSWVDYLEIRYLSRLTETFGYEWAIRVEDFLILLTTLIFALCLIFLLFITFLVRGDTEFTIRFSEKLNGLAYMWVERNGMKELVFKKPKSFLDKVEFIISMLYIRSVGQDIPIRTTKIRIAAIICLILFIILTVCVILSLLFMFNVVSTNEIIP